MNPEQNNQTTNQAPQNAPAPAAQPVAVPTTESTPVQNTVPAGNQPAYQPPVPGTVQQPQTQQPTMPEEKPANSDKKGDNSTQNALQIAEIRDGIVIMNDGSFRSVVLAKSINFDLMSPEEREAVEYAYAGFLNSLYFPVQIFIRSNRVDIRPYIEKLDKLRQEHENMLLALMMDDYIDFIAALSEQTNIMDKRFYVVVPYYPPINTQAMVKGGKKLFGNLFSAFTQNKPKPIITIDEASLEKAKTELKNRVQAVMSGLNQVSVQTIVLDTEELIELYYDAYNPDTATHQQIRDFGDLTAPLIGKGQGQAVDPNLSAEQ